MEILMNYMILIILMSNFIINLLSIIFKLKLERNVLGCGLTGFCGARAADPAWIKLVMFYNMDRGEDGTGVAINNKIKKDTEKVSKFLQSNSLDIAEDNENYTIIGHARKSSSGTKANKELVHPFGMYKGGVEKEKYDLILAMNGTLSNTEVLAEKFDVTYKEYTNSDTQIMTRIMANLGEKEYIQILEGYMGTATLLFFSPKYPNTLMVYKDPERTLFYWQKEKDEMYISSIEEPLLCLGAEKDDIKAFEGEHLYKINKGKITKDEKVVRIPIKPKVKNISYGHNSYNNSYDNRAEYYEGNCMNRSPVIPIKTQVVSIIGKRGENKYHANRGNFVYTIGDKYYRNGHSLTGKFYINGEGKVKDGNSDKKKDTNIKLYYFVNGFLCRKEEDYNIVMKRSSDSNNIFNLAKFKTIYLSELVDHFEYPIVTIVNSKEQWVLGAHWSSKIKTSGDTIVVDMFLSNETFILKSEGKWISTTKKDVCELIRVIEKGKVNNINVSFKENDDPVGDIKKEYTKQQTFDFIDKSIEENLDNPIQSCQYYYSLIRKELWKQNTSDPVREYFFITFLEFLHSKSVVNTDNYNDLKIEGKKGFYGAADWLKEIDKCLEILIKKRSKSKEKEVNWSRNNSEEKFEKFNIEDIVTSMYENNLLYNNIKFKEEIIDADYETLDQLLIAWVKIENSENIREFCEAVLLCFCFTEFITMEEGVKTIDLGAVELKSKCHSIYLRWRQVLKTQVESAKSIISKDEPVEFEPLTPESHEEDMQCLFKETIDSLIDAVQQSEIVGERMKTDWVKRAEIDVAASVVFLRKRLFGIKPEKLAHND